MISVLPVVHLIKFYPSYLVKTPVMTITSIKSKSAMVIWGMIEIECHTDCKECSNSGKRDCTECDPPLLLWENQCLNSCPAKTYPSTTVCLPCEPPCGECETKEKCLSCSEDFYWYKGDCLSTCPEGNYADALKRSCEPCNIACLTCYGPSNRECFECNYFENFNRTSTRECELLSCNEKTYVSINYDKHMVECLDCHEACASCDGDDKTDCFECNKGYSSFIESNNDQKVTCKKCNEINIGYYTDKDGFCQGIIFLIL